MALDFSRYVNDRPYPVWGQMFFQSFVYSKGRLICKVNNNDQEAIQKIKIDYPKAVFEVDRDQSAFEHAKLDWRSRQDELKELFIEDLYKDLGLEKNPFTSALFDLAWCQSHSFGFQEVYSTMVDLSKLNELAKKVYGANNYIPA
jgi:hypothetical protein